MTRKNISSGSPYEATIGFSRAVRVGKRISVAGTAPINSDGNTASPGNAYGQAKRCLEIIVKALREAGAEPSDVVRTRIMLIDPADWEEVGRAHGEVFGSVRPASTVVVVKGFVRDDWLVEIEAEAMLS
jgi:enamine deaminase RidA (YjgF/YER057c/UK114 family)